MDQTTVSRALKPLIRDGYIAVTEGETRRDKALSLTRKGKALYKDALGPWKEAQKMLRKKLGNALADALLELSRVVVEIKH